MKGELIRAGDQDKDTSRYNLALSQTLDSLRASRAWIEVRNLRTKRGIRGKADPYVL